MCRQYGRIDIIRDSPHNKKKTLSHYIPLTAAVDNDDNNAVTKREGNIGWINVCTSKTICARRRKESFSLT